MSDEFTNVLIRMSLALKERLQREAFASGRKLTGEINLRLEASLREPAPFLRYSDQPHQSATHAANDNGPASALSDADRAILEIFRRLPAEKQLALISLFK